MKLRQLSRLGAAFILSLSSLLAISMPLAHAAGPFTCNWTGLGGDNNFSTAGNWSSCNGAAPSAGDNDLLVFDNTGSSSNVTASNDITGLSVTSIVFSGTGTGHFTLAGDDISDTSGITNSTNTTDEIDNNVTFMADQPLEVDGTGSLSLEGVLSGSGNLTKTGTGTLNLESNNSFTGNLVANAGTVVAETSTALGTADGSTTINDGADLALADCLDATQTVAENITLNGDSSNPGGTSPTPKLSTAAGNCGGSSGFTETYGAIEANGGPVTLSGDLTLGSDITFGSFAQITNLTGALSGNFNINLLPGYSGSLVVNGSSNSLATANGVYNPAALTTTLSDSQPSNSVDVRGNSVVTIDGTRSDVLIENGATLKGTGTLSTLTINSGGTVAPGHSPGCLSTGDLALLGTYQAEIGGTTACTDYDQLVASGSVAVTGATLTPSIVNGFVPQVGQSFTIVNNTGTDPVTGTFSGQAEGSSITVTGVTFSVSYVGGDGNDVVLTVTNVDASKLPTKPNTGLKLVTAHPLVSLAISTMAALFLVFTARRLQPATSKKR